MSAAPITKAIQYAGKGMFVYHLGNIHVCSLVETEPDSWEIVCMSVRKKRVGSYSKARKLTDDFIGMLLTASQKLKLMDLSEETVINRFDEFVAYRRVN